MWSLVAFLATDDVFPRFAAFSLTIPYAFGMWTRSYALDRGMNAQMIVAFIPLTVALILAGGWYPTLTVVGLVPLFLFIKGASLRLKSAFVAEIQARNQTTLLAERLDTALNNMSHGLCMIDGQGRLILANHKFLSLLGLPGDSQTGAHWRVIIRKLIAAGRLDQSTVITLTNAILRGAHERDFLVPFETRDGRAIEAVVHRMANEGTVLVIQDVTDRRNAEIKINRMAHFDAVTELPNRHSFEIALAAALDPETPRDLSLTVMFLDLDNFKQVNDSLGHRTGDKLLLEIARRLRLIVGARDLVARWGGDEFVILHRHDADEPATPELARLIIEAIGKPVVIDGGDVIVGVSIGAASAPDDGLTADALLVERRHRALCGQSRRPPRLARVRAGDGHAHPGAASDRTRAARRGRNRRHRRLLPADPRCRDPADRLVRGARALAPSVARNRFARRIHPDRRGDRSDGGFRRGGPEARLRRPAPPGLSMCRVSVNLSPSQFRSGKIETVVAEALTFAGLAPDRLDLEITESTLLDDRGDTRAALAALRARGCRISLDDFGTGYSSLSYLLSFPLDRIKIDRSFTMGLGMHERASILVESVAAMSRKLGMTVLIEGVETERQMTIIEQLGTIAEAQGYLFSPPVPLSAVEALFDREPAARPPEASPALERADQRLGVRPSPTGAGRRPRRPRSRPGRSAATPAGRAPGRPCAGSRRRRRSGRRSASSALTPIPSRKAPRRSSRAVSTLTATTSKSLPPFSAWSRSSAGISARQGTHQVAQRLSSTARPRKSASAVFDPSGALEGERHGRAAGSAAIRTAAASPRASG